MVSTTPTTSPQKIRPVSSVCTCIVIFLLGFSTHYFLSISLSTNSAWVRHHHSSSSSSSNDASSSSSATMRSSNSAKSSSPTITTDTPTVVSATSTTITTTKNDESIAVEEEEQNPQSKGMRILAVDANPQLVNASITRFSSAVASNTLKLLNTGLVGEPSSAVSSSSSSSSSDTSLTFWVNKNDKFSSFRESGGCRDGSSNYMPTGDHTFCRPITVPTRTCASLITEYGTPLYMKIDIEGFDGVCVRSVATLPVGMRPRFISVENVHKANIKLLQSLGYKWFKAVCQANFQWNKDNPKLNGMSGPWGEKAMDYERGDNWLTAQEIINRLPLPNNVTINGITRRGWYDIHASK